MFHFGFSNEEKAQPCLDTQQQRRVKHVRAVHTSMKDLNAALSEALRCHDRYYAAMDKVVNLLALHSDTLEDAREQLGSCVADFTPTHSVAGQLCNAHNAWKASEEMAGLRKELDDLKGLTESGRQMTKRAKTNVEEMEKCAIRCAAVNSTEHRSKIAERSGKAREKALVEQREVNAKMAMLDTKVQQDVQATGVWWSEKVALHCGSLYTTVAQLGQRTVALFPLTPAASHAPPSYTAGQPPQKEQPPLPPPPPPPAASSSPPALYSTERRETVEMPVVGQPVNAAQAGGYGAGANSAAGVPLEFQTSRVNAEYHKTLD